MPLLSLEPASRRDLRLFVVTLPPSKPIPERDGLSSVPVSGASRDACARKLSKVCCYLPSVPGKQGLPVVSASKIPQNAHQAKQKLDRGEAGRGQEQQRGQRAKGMVRRHRSTNPTADGVGRPRQAFPFIQRFSRFWRTSITK